MKKKGFSIITVIICAAACIFMLGNIVTEFVIPIFKGTVADLPEGKVYTQEDIPLAIREFVSPAEERYAYTKLEPKQQEAYKRLLNGISAYADRIDIKSCGITMDELKVVYSSMRNDFPELFWIYNNCEVYSSGENVTDCLPSYVYGKNDTIRMIGQLEQIENTMEARVAGKSDYEKVMFVFNYIIDSTQYDLDSYNDYQSGNLTESLESSCNIYGTLVGRKALCEGYSKTVQFLLNGMGIECLYVTGKSEGEGHAWNYVKLDGVYYGLDVTWCDPKSEGDIKSYAYCLVDYNTLKINHEEDVPYPLPDCLGGRYNYYRYNGYELSTFSVSTLDAMFYKAYVSGNSFVEIHCTTETVYDSLLHAIEDQTIFDCFNTIEAYTGKRYETLNYGVIEDVWTVRIGL